MIVADDRDGKEQRPEERSGGAEGYQRGHERYLDRDVDERGDREVECGHFDDGKVRKRAG